MKHNVIIRIGAEHWDARVRVPGTDDVVEYDFSQMTKQQRRIWRNALVQAFRRNS
jgi:hypothetical protein